MGVELDMRDVLETVGEFGTASLELVAWEFSVEPSDVALLWQRAISRGLLGQSGVDESGEVMYRLTHSGSSLIQTPGSCEESSAEQR